MVTWVPGLLELDRAANTDLLMVVDRACPTVQGGTNPVKKHIIETGPELKLPDGYTLLFRWSKGTFHFSSFVPEIMHRWITSHS